MFTDARTIFVDLHNMFAKVRFAIRSQSVSDVHRPSLSFRRSTQQTFANVRRCLQMIRNSSQLYSAGFDKCLQILPDFRNKFTVFGRFSQNFRWLYLCSQFLNRLQILADVCRFLKGRLAVYVMRAYLVFRRPSFWSMPTHQNLKNCERYGRYQVRPQHRAQRAVPLRISSGTPERAAAGCGGLDGSVSADDKQRTHQPEDHPLPFAWTLTEGIVPPRNQFCSREWVVHTGPRGRHMGPDWLSSSSGPPERG